MSGFDVVTVPDFSGPAAGRFQAQTLVFLAAWMKYSGVAGRCPLHLACIGDPPPCVQKMAAEAGARISIFPPIAACSAVTANKLRGLEIPFSHPQRLLLDTDVMILGDISPLLEFGGGLAAAPVFAPRVPLSSWPSIYESCGQPLPTERGSCVLSELGLPAKDVHFSGQHLEFVPAPPSWNSGVLWIPADCRLRVLWEEYLGRLNILGEGDQTALAVAIHRLREEGISFRRLPPEFHAAWPHLFAGRPDLNSIRLFHAFGLGRIPGNSEDIRKRLIADIQSNFSESTRLLPPWRRRWIRLTRRRHWSRTLNDLGQRLSPLFQEGE